MNKTFQLLRRRFSTSSTRSELCLEKADRSRQAAQHSILLFQNLHSDVSEVVRESEDVPVQVAGRLCSYCSRTRCLQSGHWSCCRSHASMWALQKLWPQDKVTCALQVACRSVSGAPRNGRSSPQSNRAEECNFPHGNLPVLRNIVDHLGIFWARRQEALKRRKKREGYSEGNCGELRQPAARRPA